MARKTLALALASGGWRGLAHLGVIKALEKNHVPIDFIAGCSVGALIGGFYSYFQSAAKIEAIVNSFGYRSLYSILFEPEFRSGIIKGKKFQQFIEKHIGSVKIQNLAIKFCAVCTDLVRAQPVILNQGKLSQAIRASTSIPIIFPPCRLKGRYLIDGGAYAPVPVEAAKSMGPDIIVAVNLYHHVFPFKKKFLKQPKLTPLNISRISYQMLLYNLAERDCAGADIVINPKIWEGHFNIFKNFVDHQSTVKAGEMATQALIPQIRKLLQ